MKKRAKQIIVAIIIVIVIASVAVVRYRHTTKDSDVVPYWTNLYMAAGVKEEYSISLTFFSKQKIDFSKLSAIDLKDIDSYVTVDEFEVEDMENSDYASKAISMNLKFLKKGEVQTDTLIFHYLDGTQKEYHPGKWEFEIGKKAEISPEEDTTPGATSNPNTFAYEYKFSKNTMLEKIKIGEEKEAVIHETGKVFKDKLENNQEAPLILIRPKMTTTDGIYYGNASYCGALYVDKESVEKSFSRK